MSDSFSGMLTGLAHWNGKSMEPAGQVAELAFSLTMWPVGLALSLESQLLYPNDLAGWHEDEVEYYE